MNWEQFIRQAIRQWGPLGLMDLRRKLAGMTSIELTVHQVKAEVKIMLQSNQLIVTQSNKGFMIYLPEQLKGTA